MNHPCVIPVSASDALEWVAGRLRDVDLVLRSRLAPEAVFIVNLPDLSSYRDVLRQARAMRELGAVCLIARTGNPVVDSHMCKYGAVASFREDVPGAETKFRFIVPPDGFKRWVDKLKA